MTKGLEIRVRGQVQGVGFRPFVWALAREMGLNGTVQNDPEGVLVRVCGAQEVRLPDRIRAEAPPLSRVDAIELRDIIFDSLPSGFEIIASQGGGSQTRVTPDAATCAACLAELRDPSDRRFGYAFANCTNCGPRFTIIQGMPYDRAKTTMAEFPMCEDCAAEYGDPGDRRFHAQPVACHACGPRLWFESDGHEHPGDPIAEAAEALREGKIIAIKGLGGFHLACDARNGDALHKLRQRKRRPSKPFALMGTHAMIRAHCRPTADEQALLNDPAAPIVLLLMAGAPMPDLVAPGQGHLGWMLPYTPVHHLLMDAFDGPLVMTSGNLSGEPQVIGNDEARSKLAAFVDGFLMHNRAIARRLDDSVERITPQGPMVLRRARGRVPGTLPLPDGFEHAPQVVAYGGQMKGALCLLKNGQALLGHHLGDLEDALSYDAFVQASHDYAALFDHAPQIAACDLHPDFAASRYAQGRGLPVTQVQHHHAHLAACLGENGWPLHGGKVAGIVLDGLGLGADGTVWGGEVLLGDYHRYERRHWLTPAPLIGGDRAQSEPWRNGLVRLDQAGLGQWAEAIFADKPLDIARQAAARGINAPMSSSAGRLFDAVAACLGLCSGTQSFEGEAAMRLETLASAADPAEAAYGYRFADDGGQIDPAPIWPLVQYDLRDGQPLAVIALRFHAGIAMAFAARARALVRAGEAEAVALSGGCFQNAILQALTVRALGDVPVLLHHKTPANDGGLALGQALVAAARALEAH